MASGIKNGNKESPTEIGVGILKIVVIGEPKCGKTTFIREIIKNNTAGPETSINGVRVYNCTYERNGQQATVAFIEIPGHPDFFIEQRKPHYERANIMIFMYAIDDPSSFEMLSTKWMPEASASTIINALPVALVGNKSDLRNNQQVIEQLALNNQVPVTPEQAAGFFGNSVQRYDIMEISSYNTDEVVVAFTKICDLPWLGLYL